MDAVYWEWEYNEESRIPWVCGWENLGNNTCIPWRKRPDKYKHQVLVIRIARPILH